MGATCLLDTSVDFLQLLKLERAAAMLHRVRGRGNGYILHAAKSKRRSGGGGASIPSQGVAGCEQEIAKCRCVLQTFQLTFCAGVWVRAACSLDRHVGDTELLVDAAGGGK